MSSPDMSTVQVPPYAKGGVLCWGALPDSRLRVQGVPGPCARR